MDQNTKHFLVPGELFSSFFTPNRNSNNYSCFKIVSWLHWEFTAHERVQDGWKASSWGHRTALRGWSNSTTKHIADFDIRTVDEHEPNAPATASDSYKNPLGTPGMQRTYFRIRKYDYQGDYLQQHRFREVSPTVCRTWLRACLQAQKLLRHSIKLRQRLGRRLSPRTYHVSTMLDRNSS